MINLKKFYKNKKVLVTGATGFKGAWLCAWLLNLGAKVYGTGYSAASNKKLFYQLELDKKINLKLIDIRNYAKLKNFINISKPSIIFHLAGQPLVYLGYQKPYFTSEVNYIGALNILEIARVNKFIKSVVIVSAEACYESDDKVKIHKENDKLGGVNTYSASKSSAELITKAYRESFFKNKKNCGLSTARPGNVIGGGDWSAKRLIPDCIKSLINNKIILLRNPNFRRPWYHVLEPLKGYLILGKKQFQDPLKYSGCWNFGAHSKSVSKVEYITKNVIKFWGKGKIKVLNKNKFYEQKDLKVDSTKALKKLGWFTTYNVMDSIKITTEWYLKVFNKEKSALDITNEQIDTYMKK